jgi:hypothetical protein
MAALTDKMVECNPIMEKSLKIKRDIETISRSYIAIQGNATKKTAK